MNVIISSIDRILNFAKANSLSPLVFGMSCCAEELHQLALSEHNTSEINPDIFTNSPEQADLLICTGLITEKSARQLIELYKKMPEPKYVIAMGACAISGGIFCESYTAIQGADSILPVDIYLPGCPPKPEAIVDALAKLKNNIKNTSFLNREEEIKSHHVKLSEALSCDKNTDDSFLEADKL